MAEFFEEACGASGISLVARTVTTAAAATQAITAVRASEPVALVSLGMWDLPRALSLELHAQGWPVAACANSVRAW